MIDQISFILVQFKGCFRREASFGWFVVIIMGFIIRLDHYGVTSIIRWLGLKPSLYTSLLGFFRAKSWRIKDILHCWHHIVWSCCPLVTIDDRYLLCGDGIKISKEAQKMPGVKKLHQESDNSGKAPYIHGHHYGVIGILAGWVKKIFCVPLCAELHEGVEELRKFQGKTPPTLNGEKKTSVTTLMASMAANLAMAMGTKCLIVLDAYFSVGPVFLILKEAFDSNGERFIHIITRAKSNVVAYEDPPPKTGRSGRPRKYGLKLKLSTLFEDREDQFEEIDIVLYGQRRTISYLCLDLIWKPIKEKVRFVLVRDGAGIFILMCSDLTLSASDIIKAYSFRFKIEVNFKVLKHLTGVFFYRFWTSVCPRLAGKKHIDLSEINDPRSKRLINQVANAIEGFVNFGCIATGILQILSLNSVNTIWKKYTGWLRTFSSTIPSEEVVRSVIQEEYFYNFRDFKNSAIYQIIISKTKK